MMGRISLNARYRAKVWGFERLLDSSLSWHQQESTGNKAQRLLTGAEAVREWMDAVLIDFLSTFATFAASLIAGILLHPLFIIFYVYYIGVLIVIERYFDRRIDRLSNRINQSLENASGGFVESASNILSVKALGAADAMTSNLAQREELTRRLSNERLRLGNTKWMCYQIHNGFSWGSICLPSPIWQSKASCRRGSSSRIPPTLTSYARRRPSLQIAFSGWSAQIQSGPHDVDLLDRQSLANRATGIFQTIGKRFAVATPSFTTTVSRPPGLFLLK